MAISEKTKTMAIIGFTKELYFTTSTVIDWMIVERPEYYLYSSARDYCGEKGLIDVMKL